MIKKVLKYTFILFKGLSVLLGLPIVLSIFWLVWLSIGDLGEDVSKKDLGIIHNFNKKEEVEDLPNILLIMADDLGYADLGCYNSSLIKTPNIDSLAAHGALFTDHYSGAAVCSPSRMALMTGRYPIRGGVSSVMVPSDLPFAKKMMWHSSKILSLIGAVDMGADSKYNGIRHQEITIAEALKSVGYRTGMAGKWHLGDLKARKEFSPLYHGFDDFMGLNAANDEFPAALFENDSMLIGDVGLNQDFLTEIFTKRCIDFISKEKEQPFFYYLSYTAPHLPLVPSAQFKNKSEGGIYGDVVEEMDYYIGKVINTLEKNGQAENTLVIFTSDNGPWFKGSPGDFRGRKGQSFEGGYRVPLIVKWPNKIEQEKLISAPVMNFDWFPTLFEIAGIELPEDRIIDGKSLLPLLYNQTDESPHEALFFYHFDQVEAVRSGDWKYIQGINHYIWPILQDKKGLLPHSLAEEWFGKQSPNLYNLKEDAGENYDLSHHRPDKVEQLSKILKDWEEDLNDNVEGWLEQF